MKLPNDARYRMLWDDWDAATVKAWSGASVIGTLPHANPKTLTIEQMIAVCRKARYHDPRQAKCLDVKWDALPRVSKVRLRKAIGALGYDR